MIFFNLINLCYRSSWISIFLFFVWKWSPSTFFFLKLNSQRRQMTKKNGKWLKLIHGQKLDGKIFVDSFCRTKLRGKLIVIARCEIFLTIFLLASLSGLRWACSFQWQMLPTFFCVFICMVCDLFSSFCAFAEWLPTDTTTTRRNAFRTFLLKSWKNVKLGLIWWP